MSTADRITLTPEQNLARAALLDELARLDGRLDGVHPYRETYSGLARPFTRLMALEGAFAHLEGLIHTVARLEARIQALEAPAGPTVEPGETA